MEVAAAMGSGCSGVEEEEEQRDVFDELPEAILLEIFNKIKDAKSLCFCLSTCKRFGSLIPLTAVLHLTLPSPHHPQRISKSNHQLTTTKPVSTSTNKTNLFKSFINRVILTPVRFLLLLKNNNKKSPPCSHCDGDTNDDFHLPSQILKNFNEIRSLRIQLPRNVGDISNTSSRGGIDKLNPLLKWNAKFGSQLQSCVILAAANSSSSSTDPQPNSDVDDHQVNNNESSSSPPPSYLSNEELKLRVVWTISCLIAASARHHMLKQIVLDHGSLEDAVISDGSNQGKISMDKAQVEDLRRRRTSNNAADVTSSSSSMEELPALRMHMWYVPVLKLPESGCVLNGATLVVIRPVEADSSATTRTSTGTTTTTSTDGGGGDELLAMGAFDSDEREGDIRNFREAVGKMIKKKRAYSLQMSPF